MHSLRGSPHHLASLSSAVFFVFGLFNVGHAYIFLTLLACIFFVCAFPFLGARLVLFAASFYRCALTGFCEGFPLEVMTARVAGLASELNMIA